MNLTILSRILMKKLSRTSFSSFPLFLNLRASSLRLIFPPSIGLNLLMRGAPRRKSCREEYTLMLPYLFWSSDLRAFFFMSAALWTVQDDTKLYNTLWVYWWGAPSDKTSESMKITRMPNKQSFDPDFIINTMHTDDIQGTKVIMQQPLKLSLFR